MLDGTPEIFASVQGEGVSTGVPSVFVRLAECNLKCTWCFVRATPVLMADWTWRPIGDVRPGDDVIGIREGAKRGEHVKLAPARVTRTSYRHAATVTVNGSVRCTPDHKFWLTGRDAQGRSGAAHSGWREVGRAVGLRVLFTCEPETHHEQAYERGWLAGMADGDGCFWTLTFRRGYRRFRLALNDADLLERAEVFAQRAGYELRRGLHHTKGFSDVSRRMSALWLTADREARAFERWVGEDLDDPSWHSGYLGGILDAEGSHSAGALRIAQHCVNGVTRERIQRTLTALGLQFTVEDSGFYVHSSGGEAWRALSLGRPAKSSLARGAFGRHPHASRVIESVEATNKLEEVVTLTTTLGSYVAGGYVVKNCDTKYTWDWENHVRDEQVLEQTEGEVLARIAEVAGNQISNVVITGGEPLLQQEPLSRIARELKARGARVEVETSGTIEPSPELAATIDQWNVSPKLESSGNKRSARLRTGPLVWFAPRPHAFFKFVIVEPNDLDEVAEIAERFSIPSARVVVMPEGVDAAAIAARSAWLVDECVRRGYRFSTRLHVLLWGGKRGT